MTVIAWENLELPVRWPHWLADAGQDLLSVERPSTARCAMVDAGVGDQPKLLLPRADAPASTI
jgi:hypothetical protein